jgi:hypothetical protein
VCVLYVATCPLITVEYKKTNIKHCDYCFYFRPKYPTRKSYPRRTILNFHSRKYFICLISKRRVSIINTQMFYVKCFKDFKPICIWSKNFSKNCLYKITALSSRKEKHKNLAVILGNCFVKVPKNAWYLCLKRKTEARKFHLIRTKGLINS